MPNRRTPPPPEQVVILAPRRLWEELAARVGDIATPRFFETRAELEAWDPREVHHSSIYPHVVRALEEIGCAETTLSPLLKRIFRRLCECERVPPLPELLGSLPKRTFYLAWSAQLPESPRKFFERVRLRHAMWLVEQVGLSAQEAAYAAGFAQAATFYRARRRLMSSRAK
jgi:AraC-like DNA-binding protein